MINKSFNRYILLLLLQACFHQLTKTELYRPAKLPLTESTFCLHKILIKEWRVVTKMIERLDQHETLCKSDYPHNVLTCNVLQSIIHINRFTNLNAALQVSDVSFLCLNQLFDNKPRDENISLINRVKNKIFGSYYDHREISLGVPLAHFRPMVPLCTLRNFEKLSFLVISMHWGISSPHKHRPLFSTKSPLKPPNSARPPF